MNIQAGKVANELATVSPHAWAQACGHVRTEAAVVLFALLGTGVMLALITVYCVRAERKNPDPPGASLFGLVMPLFWSAWLLAIADVGAGSLATALYPQQEAARYLQALTEGKP